MDRPNTLGALKRSGYRPRSVRDEIRENLRTAVRDGRDLFPGVIGYEKTVVPQIVNAILSRHNFILLGLRGQAKTRLLRGLVSFLDEAIPAVDGSEIRDDPLEPMPDVTIADLIGDIDPIKAATRKLDFADPEVIHYGVIPRANRGLFAINELPDLAPRIQVGLLNILEEGDIQIRGFPVRLPLDLLMVFSANPEDYTNRGNIITPLKDRIESQIQTHYPQDLEHAVAITKQEAWTDRDGPAVPIPDFLREVVEELAFEARKSEYVDQNSGVSARVTISALENLVSNAERRALMLGEDAATPRLCDLGSVLPAITGKIELVYEGEQEGTTAVARFITGKAVKNAFARRFPDAAKLEADKDRDDTPFRKIIDWFSGSNQVVVSDEMPTAEYLETLRSVDGLEELVREHGAPEDDSEVGPLMELVLDGLHQFSMIAREDLEGGFLQYGDLLGNMLSQLES